MKRLLTALAFLPVAAFADPLKVENAYVPLAPPSSMAHAAYMELRNQSDASKELVGVSAEGYGMAHLHISEEKNGVATMSAVHMLQISADSAVTFAPGGLHIMLMHPQIPQAEGDHVHITLTFADGGTQIVVAKVMKASAHAHMLHNHGS
ncbi:copper chaperone PCu(A)C [Shimia sp. NS0008-38b]|uniref:copper chaperone PCu(A)C n=1 Tax=Shimia sp. NS0008-38b TaxID=3127653 RepID=UPI00310B63DF